MTPSGQCVICTGITTNGTLRPSASSTKSCGMESKWIKPCGTLHCKGYTCQSRTDPRSPPSALAGSAWRVFNFTCTKNRSPIASLIFKKRKPFHPSDRLFFQALYSHCANISLGRPGTWDVAHVVPDRCLIARSNVRSNLTTEWCL